MCCVSACVLCMFCASFLLFYSLTTALSKLWLAKLVRGRSSEPTSTAPLSQMPRPSPHWRHHHHHHRHRHMYITFPLWHWRVGSLSALQVLNSLTTNKNRRIESTWIAQFALRWLPPSPLNPLPKHFDRFNRLKVGLIVSILECKLHRLCGKTLANWTAGRPANKPFQL